MTLHLKNDMTLHLEGLQPVTQCGVQEAVCPGVRRRVVHQQVCLGVVHSMWDGLRWLVDGWGMCPCVSGNIFLGVFIQLRAVFCLYLAFLADKIRHKQRWKPHYAQYIKCFRMNLHFQSKYYNRNDYIYIPGSIYFQIYSLLRLCIYLYVHVCTYNIEEQKMSRIFSYISIVKLFSVEYFA